MLTAWKDRHFLKLNYSTIKRLAKMEQEVIQAREKSIADFKEFAQNEINVNAYSFELTDEGFGILRKDGLPLIGGLLASAKMFADSTHNFKWGVYKNIGVEIKCYY